MVPEKELGVTFKNCSAVFSVRMQNAWSMKAGAAPHEWGAAPTVFHERNVTVALTALTEQSTEVTEASDLGLLLQAACK